MASSTLADWASYPEDTLILSKSREERQHFGREPLILGGIAAVLYVAFGIWLALRFGVLGDTLARTANAHFVLFSRDPHLGAIGFVWNPLPSVLALPLVALKSLWPPLVERGIASVVVSGLSGGIAVIYMFRLLRRFVLFAWTRRIVVVVFATNPAIVYYAANGMTELPLIAALLGATDGLFGYLKDRAVADIVKSGAWLLVAFSIRYEALPWAIGVAIALAIGLARVTPQEMPARRHRDWVSGLTLVWMAPLVYGLATWIFLNWAIMGDAFYFLTSSYGNTSQTATATYSDLPAAAAAGDIVSSLRFAASQFLLWPPAALSIIAAILIGLRSRREPNGWALMLVGALLAIPLFQVVMVYLGSSAGWLRFFLVMIPFGLLALVYAVRMVRPHILRRAAWIVAVPLLIAGHIYSYIAFNDPALAHEPLSRFENAAAMAAYTDEEDLTVLTDTFLSFATVVNSDDPRAFVITSDRDFREILEGPVGQVDAILVPEPEGLGEFDAVNQAHPGLWAGEVEWAQLVHEFDAVVDESMSGSNWRLYRVLEPAETRP